MSHVELTRQALAGFLRQQAEWRTWKSEECPEEWRNEHSAEQLLHLAEVVEGLPVEDDSLRMLAMVHAENADILTPGSQAASLAGGYGFERDQDPETWLRRFVEAVVATSVEDLDDERRWL